MGFGTHPHDNMEIISIPLEGDLEHKDSMGNVTVIKKGDVQIMSAGTGITHSEYNKNKDTEVKFLQIWIFPEKRNIAPRYDQISLNEIDRYNKLQEIVSPNKDSSGVWINQQAWFYLTKLEQGKRLDYSLKKIGNGVYVFVLTGSFTIHEIELNERDGLGIWELENFEIIANSKDAELLIMDVPMSLE